MPAAAPPPPRPSPRSAAILLPLPTSWAMQHLHMLSVLPSGPHVSAAGLRAGLDPHQIAATVACRQRPCTFLLPRRRLQCRTLPFHQSLLRYIALAPGQLDLRASMVQPLDALEWLVALFEPELLEELLSAARGAAQRLGTTWVHVLAGADGHAARNAVVREWQRPHLVLELDEDLELQAISGYDKERHIVKDVATAATVVGLQQVQKHGGSVEGLVNTTDSNGITPLVHAAARCPPGMLALLLSCGARADVQCQQMPPLGYALYLSSGPRSRALRQPLCRGLLAAGANPNTIADDCTMFQRLILGTSTPEQVHTDRLDLFTWMLEYGMVNWDRHSAHQCLTTEFNQLLQSVRRSDHHLQQLSTTLRQKLAPANPAHTQAQLNLLEVDDDAQQPADQHTAQPHLQSARLAAALADFFTTWEQQVHPPQAAAAQQQG